MKKLTIAIVAGGKLDKRFLKEIIRADRIIGVDRGAAWLLEQGVTPSVAIGDFDSVTKKELRAIKKIVKDVREEPPHPKYATDLELALDYALGLKPREVIIFGGIGTRLDHTIAAVHFLEKFLEKGINGKIIDERNEIILIRGKHSVLGHSPYRYLSILPHTHKIVVSLTGFAYPLTRKELIRSTSRGISNEITGEEAWIEVHEGIALVIKSRD